MDMVTPTSGPRFISLCYHTRHEPRLPHLPEGSGRRARHGSDAAGHGPAMDGGGRSSARRAGGRAHPRSGRQCHRRGVRRRHDARGRPSGHGQLRRRGAHPRAPGEERGDLRGLGRGTLSQARDGRVLPRAPRRPDSLGTAAHGGARLAGCLGRRARALGYQDLRQVAAPAMECAEHGFPLSLFSAYQFGRAADKIRRYPTSAAIYLKDGQAPPAGHLLVETELAQTIKTMATAELKARSRGRSGAIHAARDAFYKGDIAGRIADFHAKEGGLLTREDLAEFSVEVAPALKTTFGDYEVATCGFWCQGPVLLQMLNLIEGYDMRALGHTTPRALHIMTEAMKLAFADREAYYGDPLHVKVPADGLLSKEYARARRALIRADQAWPDLPPAGDPLGLRAVANGGHGVSGHPAIEPGGSLDSLDVWVVDSECNAFWATPSEPVVV